MQATNILVTVQLLPAKQHVEPAHDCDEAGIQECRSKSKAVEFKSNLNEQLRLIVRRREPASLLSSTGSVLSYLFMYMYCNAAAPNK
jgi:hypothetical protein